MNFFTVNQVNQVYVVNAVDTVNSEAALGTVEAKADADGCLYFKHMGAGGVTRSDLIDPKEILWARKTPAEAMRKRLSKWEITLNPNINKVDDVAVPVPGQDYILNIEFDNYIGISPEDSRYWKHGAVHATTFNTPDAESFYKAMAISLANNFSREAIPMAKVAVVVSNNEVEVKPGMKADDATLEGATKIVLTGVEPDWILGLKQQKPMNFKVFQSTILYEGEEVEGLSIEDVTVTGTDNIIENGKLMADFEFFFHGERGDQLRLSAFPEFVPTKYLVDPSKKYDTIGIHFAYVGDNQSCQRSEKDITFIVDTAKTTSLVTAIETIIGEGTIKDLYTTSRG